MALINCSECGNQVNENDSVCSNCGNPLNQNMFNTDTINIFNQPQEETTTQKLLCSECGNQVNENDNICQNCGNPLNQNISNNYNDVLYNNDNDDAKYMFYISLGTIFGILSFIGTIILSIICWASDNDEIFYIGFIVFGVGVCISFITSMMIKWFGYVLKALIDIKNEITKK